MSEAVTVVDSFEKLDLDPRIIAAVTELGFTTPTPIQAQAIPPLLAGRDLVGRARTGSGKTGAFGLPLLELLSRGGAGVRALVLAPTRELALQITAALRAYGAKLRPKTVTLYGGASYQPQLAALRQGVDLVVGTPGRLLDHLRRGSLDLSSVDLVVIDEADEMLRMGFIDDLTQILQATPATRQVALFSATMPPPIRQVADKYLHQPLEVQVEQSRLVVEHIEQHCIEVPQGRKVETLARVLQSKSAGATLIFARTRVTCDELAESLRDLGFAVQALHGEMSQPAREEALGALRTGRLDLVVATDVAARGIDVEHLTHVINFDLPEQVEVYVNRIGRTGRAGRRGVAISLVKHQDRGLLRRFEQRLRRSIERRPVPSDAQIVERQRADLLVDLQAALDHPNKDNAQELAQGLAQGEWTQESLLTAALGLLMQDRHLAIEAAPSAKPPAWAQARERPDRNQRRPSAAAHGQPRGWSKGARPLARSQQEAQEAYSPGARPAGPAEAQATLSAGAGRQQGIGPKDVVGALTNELGVPFRAIGRVAIHERHLTVELSSAAAAYLLRKKKRVFLRGNSVTFSDGLGDGPEALSSTAAGEPSPARLARARGQLPLSRGPRPASRTTPAAGAPAAAPAKKKFWEERQGKPFKGKGKAQGRLKLKLKHKGKGLNKGKGKRS